MDEERVDLCILGAGTAGFAAAEAASAAGRTVAIVTGAGALGGTCINRGCMPAKTLLRTSEVEGIVASAGRVGIDVPRITVDVERVIARERDLVAEFAQDRVAELERFRLVRGDARFVGRDAVAVDGRRIVAERFLVATGAAVVPPEIPGLRESGYVTADDVLRATTIPRKVAVLGAGPVGCEFAQWFARLGAEVTLIEAGPRPLRAEDDDVGDALAAALRADGITLLTDARVDAVRRAGDGVALTLCDDDAVRELLVDEIFVATERRPQTAGLDPAEGGIAVDERGAVVVDAALRSTTNPAVFAAGDVIGRRCTVHAAAAEGAYAARAAFEAAPVSFDADRWDHHAIATQPQIAVAGLTERTAAARGIPVRVARLGFADVGKALVADEADGFVKMLAAEDGRVVGVAIVSEVAIDLVATAIAFLERGARVAEIANAPYLHPTMSEALQRVAERLAA